MLSLIRRAINKSSQKQAAGNNSTNLQGQAITINQGISYSDAKEIALDVFKANYLELRTEAAAIAQKRAEEVTDDFISKLSERNPNAIEELKQPAMQDALFTVQKQYAKSGDKELGDLLVDILVDRAAEPKRNMLQIVLDESLNVAPKLTIEQLDTITLNFLLARTRCLSLQNYQELVSHFTKTICPFIENLTSEHTHYNHIEYLGCGHVRAGDYGQLENNLRSNYKAYFSMGFTPEEFESEVGSNIKLKELLIPCFHTPQRSQLCCMDDNVLENMSKERAFSNEEMEKLKQLFEKTTMAQNDVKTLLVQENPSMSKVFDVWDNSPLKKLELTSVGIAIAHANYRRKTGHTLDLSIWIK